jgi:hypothetical protein
MEPRPSESDTKMERTRGLRPSQQSPRESMKISQMGLLHGENNNFMGRINNAFTHHFLHVTLKGEATLTV